MVDIIEQNYKENIRLFNEVKQNLLSIIKDSIVVEHVGSTAIPDMIGKNIIDVVIGVNDISKIEGVAQKLEKNNFYRGSANSMGEYIFFASSKKETKSGDVHIHLVLTGSNRFNDFLYLKKYLLDNPIVAKNYSDIKLKLVKLADKDREKYKSLKSKYVEEIIIKAREYNAN